MFLQNKYFKEIILNIAGMVASLIVLYPCAFWLVINIEAQQGGVKYKHQHLYLWLSVLVCLLFVASFLYFLVLLLRTVFSLIKGMIKK